MQKPKYPVSPTQEFPGEFSKFPSPGVNLIDAFLFVTYEWANYAIVFVPGKPFTLSVMFVSKAGAYQSGELPSYLSSWPYLQTCTRLEKHSSLFGPFVSYEESYKEESFIPLASTDGSTGQNWGEAVLCSMNFLFRESLRKAGNFLGFLSLQVGKLDRFKVCYVKLKGHILAI